MSKKLITVSSVGLIFSLIATSAAASDFEAACIAGSPEGLPDGAAETYCACLAEATEGDDAVRSELEASWPVPGSVEDWVASLSSEASEAASSCGR